MSNGVFLQFGAGKIGRSLIGDLFSSHYQIQFVDVDSALVAALNEQKQYSIRFSDTGQQDRERVVGRVTALDANDVDAVCGAITHAEVIGVSVGKDSLPDVAKCLAVGLTRRFLAARDSQAVDVIVAENIQDSGPYLGALVQQILEETFADGAVGFVSTCIGRTAPKRPRGSTAAEIVRVVADSATDFYADATAFVGSPPDCPGFQVVANIGAYVQRKLFVHNMTHSAIAYLARRLVPQAVTIEAGVQNAAVRAIALDAGMEVVEGLRRRYPGVFSEGELKGYCHSLFERYANPGLKDGIDRVGRDLPRKLGRDERLLGPYLLLVEYDLPRRALGDVIAAAFRFPDPASDATRLIDNSELDLAEFCGLRKSHPLESQACSELEVLLSLCILHKKCEIL